MFNSSLFDENSFYDKFTRDLLGSKREVIIESPFITTDRVAKLDTRLKRLIRKNVRIYIVTRLPELHSEPMQAQAEKAISYFEKIGVQVLATKNNHHRKLAIIDREILWEGSLNILSQNNSREIMRRIDNDYYAIEMFNFLGLGKIIT